MPRTKKIALVLGGGGARGLSQIGVLKVLDRSGIKPNLIVGSSIGAVIGAAYAIGIDPMELENEALKYKRKRDIARFLDPGIPREALFRGNRLAQYIDKLLLGKNFSDAKIPLNINATDLGSGREVVIKRGNIAKAAMASISVPGIFPPIKIGDQYLLDGAVVNPTPVDIAWRQKCDIIIAVDFIMRRGQRLTKPNIVSTIILSYEIIRSEAVKRVISRYGDRLVVVRPKTKGTIDSFRFTYIKDFIQAGEDAMQTKLAEVFKRISS